MPARKSDIKITVEANGKRFSLNCKRCIHKKYSVKLGRTRSKKKPLATTTEITNIVREWIVKQESEYWGGVSNDS